MFLCDTPAPPGQGGHSTFLDAARAAEDLRRESPAAFAFFCETSLPFHSTHDGVRCVAHGPVFEFDADHYSGPLSTDIRHLRRVRYNNDDRAPLTHLGPDDVERFYQHLPALLAVFRRDDLIARVKLARGDMVVVDNHRVMHGRTAFHGGGKRKLVGCYAEMSEIARHSLLRGRSPALGGSGRPQQSRAYYTATATAAAATAAATPHLRAAAVGQDEGAVVVTWSDAHAMSVNGCWLRHNCGCPACKEEHSGQKTIPAGAIDGVCSIESAALHGADGNTLRVKFVADGHEAVITADQLLDVRVAAGRLAAPPRSDASARAQPWRWSESYMPLPAMTYEAVMRSDYGNWQWLDHIRQNGACRIDDAGSESGVVTALADIISHPLPTLYGTTFEVRSEENPINIAYTNLGLPLHQDLVYFESPPGLQFLHCLDISADIIGGEHILIDGFRLAELFREEHPTDFATLCRIPARFQKIHARRERGARMTYHRPHISINANDELTQFTWAPAFEGPLPITDGPDVEAYYRAYAKMNELIERESENNLLVIKLVPGTVVTFNNRRMLHGRTSFSYPGSASQVRHLQGCYVNIDEFVNMHNVLADQHAERTPLGGAVRHAGVGNQDQLM